MLRFARRRADPETAEDVVSEALLVLWRRLDEVPADGATPWAIGVTRWCLANAERSARRQRGLVAKVARLSTSGDVVTPAGDEDKALHDALATLSANDRELLRLWAWDDLRPGEIAIVLGISTKNVSVRLHRAKQRLATALSNVEGRAAVATPSELPSHQGKRTK